MVLCGVLLPKGDRSWRDWMAVQSNYGMALLVDRKPDGALRHLAKARRAAPDQPDVLTNMAATLWTIRRDAEAISLMQHIRSSLCHQRSRLRFWQCYGWRHLPATHEMDRLRDLIGRGIWGTAPHLRAMVSSKSKEQRDLAFQLADVVEGKAPVPGDL